ncbi:MAG: hypothetical protein COA79_00765 [Planctomycetota bacterium]|nr:MAG: hypothetical protein COA79_00765 [Planctomycetota bacterium]
MPNINEDDELLASFIVQSNELLDGAEENLKELKELLSHNQSIDVEIFHSLFRTFHTIKGVSGFMGLPVILDITHKGESLLDLYRKGEASLDDETLSILVETLDFIRELLDVIENESTDESMTNSAKSLEKILTKTLKDLENDSEEISESIDLGGSVENDSQNSDDESTVEDDFIEEEDETFEFEIEITAEILQKFTEECNDLLDDSENCVQTLSQNPASAPDINQLFRNIHSIKGNCGFVNFANPEIISHKLESILDEMRAESIKIDEAIIKLLFEAIDVLRGQIKEIEKSGKDSVSDNSKLLQSLEDLFTNKKVMVNQTTLEEKKSEPIKEIKEEEIITKINSTELASVEALPEIDTSADRPVNNDSNRKIIVRQDIRVDMQKLDYLQNLVGELIIAKEMVSHNPELQKLNLTSFNRSMDRLTRITNELQDVSMSVRMIQISSVFKKMNRLVRDVSKKAGKKIHLELFGEETEVDKQILDLISDPLVHIIRNAGDHGIESPDDRIKNNKPVEGVIKLSARQTVSEIIIQIEDDGKGLDKELIYNKGIEKGLIPDDGSSISDSAIYQLIFAPGFSTAQKVTDISGRGVGMDVVNKNVEKAKGRIEIESTQGVGTKFTLKIPLTLATIEVMLVRVAKAKYSIPITIIQEALKPNKEDITIKPDGSEYIKIRDNIYPVLRLHELFSVESEFQNLNDGIIILVNSEEESVCLFVDEILYQVQTVVKNLSDYMKDVKTISGCNILGTGEVSLIVNIEGLIREMNKVKV